ncbi:hypothetical protein MD484_g7482, partial [Candolleomyces efflorescens]
MFLRSLDDKGSTGSSTLTFLIDNVVHDVKKITPADFTFSPTGQYTPRTMLFQAVDLEPKRHLVSVQWSFGAGDSRPAVSVALDSIEYIPANVSRSNTNTIRAIAIAVPIAAFLILLAALLFIWRKRRATARRKRHMLDMTGSEDGGSEMEMVGDRFSQSIVRPFMVGHQGEVQPSPGSVSRPVKGRRSEQDSQDLLGLPPSYQEVSTLGFSGVSGPSQSTSGSR